MDDNKYPGSHGKERSYMASPGCRSEAVHTEPRGTVGFKKQCMCLVVCAAVRISVVS